jgi:EAL domain-containing protein (putative c-di-GMP-specific phosphodiesterase class I)
MENISVALDILSRLSLKRFNLSIDDFGTGYSSMEQLQRIPFSELKIDRAFVRGASDDSAARAILESNQILAKKLNMTIVAEGVETQDDWNLVTELGCDQVQGFFVARPMPVDELCIWLRNWRMPDC